MIKNRRKIRFNLRLFFILIIGASLIGFTGVIILSGKAIHDHLMERFASDANEQAQLIAQMIKAPLRRSDVFELKDIVERLPHAGFVPHIEVRSAFDEKIISIGSPFFDSENMRRIERIITDDAANEHVIGKLILFYQNAEFVNFSRQMVIMSFWAVAAFFSFLMLLLLWLGRNIDVYMQRIKEHVSRLDGDVVPEIRILDWLHEFRELSQSITSAAVEFKASRKREMALQREAAVARTMQMLAHDVRKPFSILQMGLEMVSSAKTMGGVKETLNNIAPEVEKALTSVNGLINDVMEVGRTSAPQKEPVSPESIIEATISELCRIYPESNIYLDYNLKHIHMLDVDPLKVGRVFSNILGNAFQAMKQKGVIWIRSKEEDGQITFCLGNRGSFISKEDLPKLFEAFYTKNKKGGTGLGLAIAQKVVLSHGGKIWCESSEEKNTVEFFFSLPISDKINSTTAKLAISTKEMIEESKFAAKSADSDDKDSPSIDAYHYENKIVDYSRKVARQIRVAVVDDEAVYRNAIKDMIGRQEKLTGIISLELFDRSETLFNAFEKGAFDVLLCDIDLGPNSLNGYDILKTLRQNGCNTAVCVHSNRCLPEDYSLSIQLGAQAFLTKPMTSLHFLKFIASVVDPMDTVASQKPTAAPCRDKILLVDDESFYRTSMAGALTEVEVITLETPEDLLAKIKDDHHFLAELDGILLDNYYGEKSRITGIQLGGMLKKLHNFDLPIILVSNGNYLDEELNGHIDLALPKVPIKWSDITTRLALKPWSRQENIEKILVKKIPYYDLSPRGKNLHTRIEHDIVSLFRSLGSFAGHVEQRNLGEYQETCKDIAEKLSLVDSYFPSKDVELIRAIISSSLVEHADQEASVQALDLIHKSWKNQYDGDPYWKLKYVASENQKAATAKADALKTPSLRR